MTKIQHGLPFPLTGRQSEFLRKGSFVKPGTAQTANSPRISLCMGVARDHGLVTYHIWKARSKIS